MIADALSKNKCGQCLMMISEFVEASGEKQTLVIYCRGRVY